MVIRNYTRASIPELLVDLCMSRRTASIKASPARPSKKRDHLVTVAESLFDRDGFHGTGVDRLVADSGIARMTFYKHFPTKNALVLAVLEQRDSRFWAALEDGCLLHQSKGTHPVLAIFDALGDWLDHDGAHGCLVLRALGEFAGHDLTLAGDAAFRKRKSGPWVAQHLTAAAIEQAETRCWDLVLLMEGAMALAPVVGGRDAAGQARHAASALLSAWADGTPKG